jgi:SAM-dependent methyltransferase
MTRPPDARARALQLLDEALQGDFLHSLTLSRPVDGPPGLKQVLGRPVALKAGPHLQLVSRFERVDKTKNVPLVDALAEVSALLGAPFSELHLRTTQASWHLQAHPGKAARLHEAAPPAAAPAAAHDRPRSRALDPDPRWLTALGVLGPDGKVKRGMESKLRQVLRFAELLDDALGALPPGPLRLVDMGCGKGYLTFVAYELLSARRPGSTVVGVELRPALVETCAAAAAACGFSGLSFVAGAIAEAPLQGADVVLALHACDTATDDALAAAVEAEAALVLAAPCCHKELRPQLRPPPALAIALQHGILRTREAELLTDALRAALLDARGYSTAVIEFVDAEHTAKNLLLVATRKGAPAPAREAEARALAQHYGVQQQRLAALLGVALA